MRRWIAIAAVGMVALAGCSGDGDGDTTSAPGVTQSSAAEGAEDSSDASAGDSTGESTGDPETTGDAAFGETFTYPDGLAVSVGAPVAFTPSADALRGGEPDFVTFEVTVTNGTSAEVTTADFTVTVQSGGGEGGDVRDPGNAIAGAPTDPVAPGGGATWAVAFGVLDARDVLVHIIPGIDSDPVTFGG